MPRIIHAKPGEVSIDLSEGDILIHVVRKTGEINITHVSGESHDEAKSEGAEGGVIEAGVRALDIPY